MLLHLLERLWVHERSYGRQTSIMLQALWKLNVMDIENTVKAACDAVLLEKGLSRDVLRLRAKALKHCGRVFQARTFNMYRTSVY